MTREQHPITPPSELMQQWWDGTHGALYEFEAVVTQAARWGADQELKECRKAIADQIITVDNIGLSGPAGVLHTKAFSSWPTFAQMVSRQLHAARRPEPPSLRTALQRLVEEVLDANQYKPPGVLRAVEDARRAIESLPE